MVKSPLGEVIGRRAVSAAQRSGTTVCGKSEATPERFSAGFPDWKWDRKKVPLSHLDAEQSPRTCFQRIPSRRPDALTCIDGH
jgi:hypothetical protein